MPDVVRHQLHYSRRIRARYIAAVVHMRTMPAPGFLNLYEKYIQIHNANMLSAHLGLTFLAWHRAFLWEFEKDLQAADVALSNDGALGIPWWDWVRFNSRDHTDELGKTWRPDVLGPSGTAPNFEVPSGAFAGSAWPAPPVVTTRLGNPLLNTLRRNLGAVGALPTATDINHALRQSDYDVDPYSETLPPPPPPVGVSFRTLLEGSARRPGGVSFNHNSVHDWVGGNMANVFVSPYDPAFWVHHANIDRIWARWQSRNPRRASQWPLEGILELAPLTITTPGAGYTNGFYSNVPLSNITGTGSGGRADITVTGGAVTAARVTGDGSGYHIGDTLRVEAARLGGGTPTTLMVLTVPAGGTVDDVDITYPSGGPVSRPLNVRKLNEAMPPWNVSGLRQWTPGSVLNWQDMGRAIGEHRYRYSTDAPGSFGFT